MNERGKKSVCIGKLKTTTHEISLLLSFPERDTPPKKPDFMDFSKFKNSQNPESLELESGELDLVSPGKKATNQKIIMSACGIFIILSTVFSLMICFGISFNVKKFTNLTAKILIPIAISLTLTVAESVVFAILILKTK